MAGIEESVGSLKIYSAVPPAAVLYSTESSRRRRDNPLYICDKAIIVIHDGFGYDGGRIKGVCDAIAEARGGSAGEENSLATTVATQAALLI